MAAPGAAGLLRDLPLRFWKAEFGHNLKGAWMLLRAYEFTGNRDHYAIARSLIDYFTRPASFVDRYFRDAEAGEWFRTVGRDGTARGTHEGGDYKAALHTAGVCLHARRDLEPRPSASLP